MLLYLVDYLINFDGSFRVFYYLTFRAILGALTALTISLVIGPTMIRRLSNRNIGQNVRQDGPESHFDKAGTPTMGGALILVAIAFSTLLWADLENRYVWVVLLVTMSFGIVGFIDDHKKIRYGNSDGLSAKNKFLWQSAIGLLAAVFLFQSAEIPAETQLIVPFFKEIKINLGWFYIVLTYLIIVGFSNAVNLTDGLDGLAIMPTVMVAAALGLFAYLSGHMSFANYLSIPFLPNAGELFVFCATLTGAGLGFLWFNA